MKVYKDIDKDSGIAAYEYSDTSIRVQFKKTGKIYEYPQSQIGEQHLANMKKLADAGEGLNAYIQTNSQVRTGYKR